MTLKELRNIDPPSQLQQLSDDEYQYAWIFDFWDGAISGMLLLEGKYYWFEMTQENEDVEPEEWYRRYVVIALTEPQLEKSLEVHRDFQKYVSTSWDRVKFEDTPEPESGHMEKFYD